MIEQKQNLSDDQKIAIFNVIRSVEEIARKQGVSTSVAREIYQETLAGLRKVLDDAGSEQDAHWLASERGESRVQSLVAHGRCLAWQFHDAIPIIVFLAWAAGAVGAALLKDFLPGGVLSGFTAGFLAVFALLILAWPETAEG